MSTDKPSEAKKEREDSQKSARDSQAAVASKTDDEREDVKQEEAGGGRNVAVLAGKVEIFCDEPLPLYDQGENKAYRAYVTAQSRLPVVAIVCERHLVPRRAAASVYSGFLNASMARLLARGVVYWPPEGGERYVFIYEDNLGKPILRRGEKTALGWRQDEVMTAVVRPIVGVLQDFWDKDFVHGGIRPSNMFDGDAKGRLSRVVLGDCLSAPASYVQPALYETIPRAMADPVARGKGTQADDLYALGVSVAVIMRQNDPMYGLSDAEILKQKILVGSYAAVTGKDRFKGEVLELLRGLLNDDPAQRWDLEDVQLWLEGQRLSPRQSLVFKKAQRPFQLGADKYIYAPLLAANLSSRTKEVKAAIGDESLLNWIERSLEDEKMSERFHQAIQNAHQQGRGLNADHYLISNISIALDPPAPLRYRGMSVVGDGIGTAMVYASILGKPLDVFAGMFSTLLVSSWLGVQSGVSVDITALFKKFDLCHRHLKMNKCGSGIERVVYTLCPEAPCISPVLENYFVTGPDDLLRAYEDLSEKGGSLSMFLDRHAIAFLCEKDHKVIEPCLYDLGTGEEHRIIAAKLRCMGAIQKRFDLEKMPALARVMAPALGVVVRRYHDRGIQKKLEESIEEFRQTGDLVKIAALLSNDSVVEKDFKSFRNAMREFLALEKERKILGGKLQNRKKFGVGAGRDIAAGVSGVLAFLIIAGSSVLILMGKPLF